MNKQELFERISHLPSDCSGPLPMINTLAVLKFIKLLDEPQKVVVPQFVADWIEEGKKHCKDVFDLFDFNFTNKEVGNWFLQEKPFDLVARAWLDGYEVEKEKRYLVKIKGVFGDAKYLNHEVDGDWFINSRQETYNFKVSHTRKELEEAGFGEVFNSTLFEVEEVE